MLSYQHAYHAGNKADVHKHGTLSVLLTRMKAKAKPMTYMESHAGRALYDLTAIESLKTGEAEQGILKCLQSGNPPMGHPYRTVLDKICKKHGDTAYPGSPLLANSFLDDQDEIHLMELHPAEYASLRDAMHWTKAHVHHRDGFEGVLSLAPPRPPHPRRGLVFIDPSYEMKTEYADIAAFIKTLHAKWAEAVIVLWYPVLEAGLHYEMTDTLEAAGLKDITRREVRFKDRNTNHRLLGSGMFIINTPYGTDEAMDEVEGWFSG